MNPPEKDYSDYQNLLSCGLKTEEALSTMKHSKQPPSGEENYQYLLDTWNHGNMCTFKDFLRCYNNKHVVPTLKAMQKCLLFITRKELTCWSSGVHFRIWQLFVSTNLPVPNSIHLLKPIKTSCKRLDKIWLVVPSIVFTRKAVVEKNFIRNSRNICITIAGIDASQLYLYSMCQPILTGLYTRWEYDTESNRCKP